MSGWRCRGLGHQGRGDGKDARLSARGLFKGLAIIALLLPALLSGSLATRQATEPLNALKTAEATDGLAFQQPPDPIEGLAEGDDRGELRGHFGEPDHTSMWIDPVSLEAGRYTIRVDTSGNYSTSAAYRLKVDY